LITVEALVEKWQRARTRIEETGKAYEELTSRLDAEWIVDWMESEREALEVGGESMKIYEISMDKCEKFSCFPVFLPVKIDCVHFGIQCRQWQISDWNWQKRRLPPETFPEVYRG